MVNHCIFTMGKGFFPILPLRRRKSVPPRPEQRPTKAARDRRPQGSLARPANPAALSVGRGPLG
jgi:hypothetical protein